MASKSDITWNTVDVATVSPALRSAFADVKDASEALGDANKKANTLFAAELEKAGIKAPDGHTVKFAYRFGPSFGFAPAAKAAANKGISLAPAKK